MDIIIHLNHSFNYYSILLHRFYHLSIHIHLFLHIFLHKNIPYIMIYQKIIIHLNHVFYRFYNNLNKLFHLFLFQYIIQTIIYLDCYLYIIFPLTIICKIFCYKFSISIKFSFFPFTFIIFRI